MVQKGLQEETVETVACLNMDNLNSKYLKPDITPEGCSPGIDINIAGGPSKFAGKKPC